MKQLLVALLTVATVSGPVGPATGEEPQAQIAPASPSAVVTPAPQHRNILLEARTQRSMLAALATRAQRLRANAVAIDGAVKKLKKHVGRTWYVFSGSTPSGWDCSGLVRWTYQQVGVELEHSATKQANAGRIVKQPLPGDVVAYQYRKGSSYYHVGIYVGNGMTVQALNNTRRTMLVAADSPVVGFNKPVYIRILERDNSAPAKWTGPRASLPAN